MRIDNKPLVSICCISYNHEKYIKDAIEGFLLQKTTFPIEIIIHDDASNDNTVNIIREYEKKYPDLFEAIYQVENQYSKGIKPLPNFVFPKARGKYIALCEGDDYWIDPYKLQKQVDFLESNPEYVLVHTDADQHYFKINKTIRNFNLTTKRTFPEENVYELILRSRYNIFTCTTLFKTEYIKDLVFNMKSFLSGDTFLWLELSRKGKFRYMNESTAVRQMLRESVTQSSNPDKIIVFKKSLYKLFQFFIDKYGCSHETEQVVHYNSIKSILALAYKSGNLSVIKEFSPLAKEYSIDYFTARQKIALYMHFIYSYFKRILL